MKKSLCFLLIFSVAGIISCKKDKDPIPTPVTLESIAVTTQPTKKTYTVNEAFDPSGMVVTATYSDKSTKPVANSSLAITADFSSAGTKTATITYEGKTATVTGITVNALPAGVTLESIAVTTPPSKNTYEINDTFEPAGMVVTAKYNDNSSKTVTLSTLTYVYDFKSAGSKTVEISFTENGKTVKTTLTGITVKPETNVVSIAVTNLPNKIIYGIGETFDPDGMEITATYNDGTPPSIVNITELTFVYDFSTADYKTITITYEGKTIKIEGNKISVQNFLGKGLIGDPYLIGNPLQLAKLAELVNAGNSGYTDKYYELTANIDLLAYGASINSGAGWISIGSSTNPFKGHFDGKGKTVSNLYINSSSNNKGLFGYVSTGTITDFSVTNANVTGGNNIGSVVGNLIDGSIIKCYATGTGKVSGNDYVGGIVGNVSNSNVNNCSATSTVSGNNNVGGVAGHADNNSIISNCNATGTVSGDNNSVGGIAGWLNHSSEIVECYSTGKVSGSLGVGGVAGFLNNSSKIAKCYATGEVNGSYNVGGLAGGVDNGSITKCYNTGDVIGRDGVGGVAGNVDNGGSIAKCYAIGTISGNDGVGGIVGYVMDISSSINDCAALSEEITKKDGSSGTSFNRVAGSNSGNGILSNNAAWNNMKVNGATVSDGDHNGTSIDKTAILGDGTIGGRFTAPDGWTTQDGSLPGFGTTLTMPRHIQFD